MIGETLDGKYRIIRLIGEGGMGSVYEAETIDTGLCVAVKIISGEHLASDKNALRRFRREARAASAVGSPRIVRILEAQTDEVTGFSYIVMEHLPGEDLQHLIDRIGPLAPSVALRIASQALQGLAAAHELNIVHRDIKPANIFLTRDQNAEVRVKLLDFGIAKIKVDPLHAPFTTDLTTTGGFLGSPLYMSPEQIQNSRDVEHYADIWSLGSVLYCMLAGRAPYQHFTTLGQLLVAICVSAPPPVQDIAPWVPREVAEVVDCALKTRPEERYHSAEAMCAAIARAQESCYSGPDGSNEIKDEMLTPLTDEERSFVALKPAPRVVVKPPPATSEIIGDESTAPAHDTAAIEAMFQRMEYYNMLETLQSTDWDQEEAARRLGVSRQTLELMMKMRGIKEPEGKPEG